MGEVARCMTIAHALLRRWPDTQVHFALSSAAPYAAEVPFPSTLLPSSPTFHPREVASLIANLRPTTVLFDNAGRTRQLEAARAAGARVIYISSRRRQRRKAFRLRWMRLLDAHWIAYPSFIAGPLSRLERLKLHLLGRPRVEYLDALLPLHDAALAAAVLGRFGVHAGEYVLVVPGGGTSHAGAQHSPATLAQAARGLAQRGHATLLVGVEPGAEPAAVAQLSLTRRLPVAELCELIRGARLVIANGGDTLLQVVASRRPCIAVPMAKDQAHRIACCIEAGAALAGGADAAALEARALALLEDHDRYEQLQRRLTQVELHNALERVADAIRDLELGAPSA